MNVYDNYWLADDGRVYSSAKQLAVTDADADYIAWLGLGNVATVWPRDMAGNQTDDEMKKLIHPWGLLFDLSEYASSVRFTTLRGGITVNGRPFATDVITLGSLNSAYIYTQSNAGATFSWKLPDGTWVTLSKSDVDALQAAVSVYGQNCFECEAATLDAIAAGTITDRPAIDAAFAAIPNSITGVTLTARTPMK